MGLRELPILFVIFNRKDIAYKSLLSIRKLQPKHIFIACDGPRKNKIGEEDLVCKTRETILKAIDWECEVKLLFQEKNLGCGFGVYSAIEWFFNNVEYGVILEDDCIATQSFFRYAYEMLIRYKDDERIGMIAGTNPVFYDSPHSIIFSKYKSCWGWGTWRRAWKNMDLSMSWRNGSQINDIISNCGYRGKDSGIWRYKLRCIDRKFVSAWDWQWYFSLSAQNQLCIYPKYNQISNIGDDAEATHTSFSNITLPSQELTFPLTLPDFIVPNDAFDKKFFKLSNSVYARISRLIPHKSKMILKKIIAKCLR